MVSFTTPRDACRLSMVSTTVRSAADSDYVWEKFLPSDYKSIIARSGNPSLPVFSSKKDLYFHLCDHPLIVDEGMKSFSLEKWSGKKCYMLAARDLKIAWGDTPSYWTWTSLPEGRLADVAQLLRVCWLEIRGKISTFMLSPDTIYAAYLVFKLTRDCYELGDPPSEVSFGIPGEESEARFVCLDPERSLPYTRHQIPGLGEIDVQIPNERKDGWLEVELGEFLNKREEDEELEMRFINLMNLSWGMRKLNCSDWQYG